MPALRRHLMQLLSDMGQAPDPRQREGRRVDTYNVMLLLQLACFEVDWALQAVKQML